MNFVHLRVYSEYSLERGIVRVKQLPGACAKAGMPAIAITDVGNLFASVAFYKAAVAEGVQPIIGGELTLDCGGSVGVLAQNHAGYENLCALMTEHSATGQVSLAQVIERNEGLICLAGHREGALWFAIDGRGFDAGGAWLDQMAPFGDRLYLEVRRVGHSDDEEVNQAMVQLASDRRLGVVATNAVAFVSREDFETQQAKVAVVTGHTLADTRRVVIDTADQYLRPPEEMVELFEDIPEAVENTVRVAQRIGFSFEFGKYQLPRFETPDGSTEDEYLRAESRRGLSKRFEFHNVPTEAHAGYLARLETELDVIVSMGFPGYFLIVADFIRWARKNGVPVGPGRGSGAGSLVAWSLRITDLDPITNGLLFERFLNPERVSMPDFDVDFCMVGRDRVIRYVRDRYGADRVSQIVTFGTMKAKAAVRDANRVLNYPYPVGDRLAKAVPDGLDVSLADAERDSDVQALIRSDAEAADVFELAKKLEGMPRNISTHAGGVVIGRDPLPTLLQVCTQKDGSTAVGQDMNSAEALGLVKFDFLGLRTLTIIDWALKTINVEGQAAGKTPLLADAIPIDDRDTLELVQTGETLAVFQLESGGMRDLVLKMQPSSFEEMTALVALFRPGPLQSGMVDDFVSRKHGRTQIEYPHPLLEDILKPTYGVILYQEQVMQIAQVLAGYTLGGADLLRRAMGKKKPAEMAKQRSVFVEGAIKRGTDAKKAEFIFDLVEKFAGYGFNKSHSAAYALIAYQTAYLKHHYPQHFMAAALTAEMGNTDKVVQFVDECRRMAIEILPPDVQRSRWEFVPEGDGIRYGLGAIKGIGHAQVAPLCAARADGNPFRDFYDFVRRGIGTYAEVKSLELLIKTGACDSFNIDRARLHAWARTCVQAAQQSARAAALGQGDMFGSEASVIDAPALPDVPSWTDQERLAGEKESLGLYLSGHPADWYQAELDRFSEVRLGNAQQEFKIAGNRIMRVGGIVMSKVVNRTRDGRKMAVVQLDDGTGRLEIVLFPDAFDTYGRMLDGEALIFAEGRSTMDDLTESMRLVVEKLVSLDDVRARLVKRVVVTLRARMRDDTNAKRAVMSAIADHAGGRVGVAVRYDDDAENLIDLSDRYQIAATESALHAIRSAGGNTELEY